MRAAWHVNFSGNIAVTQQSAWYCYVSALIAVATSFGAMFFVTSAHAAPCAFQGSTSATNIQFTQGDLNCLYSNNWNSSFSMYWLGSYSTRPVGNDWAWTNSQNGLYSSLNSTTSPTISTTPFTVNTAGHDPIYLYLIAGLRGGLFYDRQGLYNGNWQDNSFGYFTLIPSGAGWATQRPDLVSNAVSVYQGGSWPTFRDGYQLPLKYPPVMRSGSSFLSAGIGATFRPNNGLTLAQTANILGFDHFNWLQLAGPTDPVTGGIDFSRPSEISIDPPLNCYPALAGATGNPCPNRDSKIWYLDEKFSVDGIKIYSDTGARVNSGQTKLEAWTADSSTLLFSDSPTVNLSFLTCLAGVDASGIGSVFNIVGRGTTCFSWKHTGSSSLSGSEDIGGDSNGSSLLLASLSEQGLSATQAEFLTQHGVSVIAVSPVPEPSTTALFIVSLGFVVAAKCRRRV